MVLSTGINKIRTAVFISGTGSNLKSLVKFSKTKLSPISINFIVSNNSKAKGLNYAKKFKIKKKVLNFKNKKGLNTHQRVLNNKEKYSGCTVHFVNARLDSGKIILQKKVKISKKDTEYSLAKKILVQEHKLYPKAILKVFNL